MSELRSRLGATLAVALAGVAVCAAPAAADHPGSEAVTAPAVTGVAPEVLRHGDPAAEFKAAANDPSGPTGRAATLSAALPAFCPTVDRTFDDARNSPHGAAATVKIIYAYPVDVGNRLSTYANVIQAGVKGVSDFVASESGGALGVRFDTGTFEGPHCLDIQRIALPQTKAYYSSPAGDAFTKVGIDIAKRLGLQDGPRNYLAYVDGVAPQGIAGEAEARLLEPGDDAASGAVHAEGGLLALLYGRGGTDFFGSATQFPPGQTSRRQVEVALHEASHNLGAVQLSSPNSSGAGHCNDLYDLMCYEDGGPGFPFIDSECDGSASAPLDPYGPDFQAWDCGRDDYFNVAPDPGSYLDTHWNLARSPFLCTLASCSPPDLQAPEVTIDKVPPPRGTSRKVKIRFSVSERATAMCRIDRRKPRPCWQGFKAKVKRGKHKIVVNATDAAGISDPTPAVAKFRVVKKSKQKQK
jgi:hypothetical protein